MSSIVLNKNMEFELSAYHTNRDIIGYISCIFDVSIKRVIDNIDEISFSINSKYIDRFSRSYVNNPIYNELKEERFICLNDSEFFVIKSISESFENKDVKTVTALSLEHKLSRINFVLENTGIVLVGEDVIDGEIAVMDLLYSETGWKVGYIDNDVRFSINSDGLRDIVVRWIDNVNDNWYSFLTEKISDIFNCIPFFDTYKKTVSLIHVKNIGDNLGLCLSKDNYIKSIEKSTDSNNLVTRLRLSGKDEMNIRSINPLGVDWVEDYSYFIENGDMSEELQHSLFKHNQIVESNHVLWTDLSSERVKHRSDLTKKNGELFQIIESIKSFTSIKDIYESQGDKDNANIIQSKIDEETLKKEVLEDEIRNLESRIDYIDKEINHINYQLNRNNVIDENGDKIFSDKSLSELNEFLYYDSYNDTSYLTEKDLMDAGKRELSKLCVPTLEYSIDSVSFISRMQNKGNVEFNGELSLGDLIILADEQNNETILYLVGFDYNVDSNTLNLSLSNKKTSNDNIDSISNYLRSAYKSHDFIKTKAYVFNQIKYNEI